MHLRSEKARDSAEMTDNHNSNPAPVSREEFEIVKNQMSELVILLREQVKIKPGPRPDTPTESSSQRQSCRPSNDSPAVINGNNLRLRQQPTFNQSPGQRKSVRTREFTPLNDSLEEVLALLIAQKKIIELAPPADPKGKLYDPSKRCAYHSGSPGHDTQDCWSLKHKIQNLIDRGDIVVERPNVNANQLLPDDTNEVNRSGAGSTRVDSNGKYKRKIEEYPQMSGANVLGWECREEIKSIKQEVLMTRHEVEQLADLVVHQSQITRQLSTQLIKDQGREGMNRGQTRNPSQIIQLTEEDQRRMKGQGGRNNKVAKRAHQGSFDNRSDKCEPSTRKDRATSSRDRKFTPLSKSRAEVLHLLISRGRIMELLPPTDPKSKSYDHTQTCLYHSNSPGHDTQECWSLKHKIQNMIDHGDIVVEQLNSPNGKRH